jgi:hypothetical protein
MIEHLGGDKVRIKPAGGLLAIMGGQLRGELRRAIEINPPTATRPEEELQGPFEISVVACRAGRMIREDLSAEVMDGAIGLFQSEDDRHGLARPADGILVGAPREHGGTELRVQYRSDTRGDESETIIRHSGEGLVELGRGFKPHKLGMDDMIVCCVPPGQW